MDILSQLAPVVSPPRVVVILDEPNDLLWAKALNMGAFDVLTKPLAADEVMRITRSALQELQYEQRWTMPLKVAVGIA